MTALSPDHRRAGRRALATIATMLAMAALCGGSLAAFSAATSNTSNTVSTGSIALSNDAPGGGALFTANAVSPGWTLTRCINVTNTGTLGLRQLDTYATATAGPTGMPAGLNLLVERGSGATNVACAGFASPTTIYNGTLSGFDIAHKATESGTPASGWGPGGSKSYRVTVSLAAAPPDSDSGRSVTFVLAWSGSYP